MNFEKMRDFFGRIPWENIGGMTSDAMGHVVAWAIILLGFIGTFMPFLPGPVLILAGALVHRFWLGAEQSLSWFGLSILAALVVLAYLVEYLASAMGAKWYGATKYGVWGALLGGLIGIFFGIPGLFLGPLAGAFAFEVLLARQRLGGATRSTWGTFVGTAVGILIKAAISTTMIAGILLDLYVW